MSRKRRHPALPVEVRSEGTKTLSWWRKHLERVLRKPSSMQEPKAGSDTGNEFAMYTVELPGFTVPEVSIEASGNTLLVSAVRQDGRRWTAGECIHMRRHRLVLPPGLDPSGARASLRHGLLTLEVPYSTRLRQTIPVEAA